MTRGCKNTKHKLALLDSCVESNAQMSVRMRALQCVICFVGSSMSVHVFARAGECACAIAYAC